MMRVAFKRFLTLALAGFFAAAAHAEVVGWRTDGTGQYPDADPPIHWSTDLHIAWSTDLPKSSNATPVIVGDRVFVCSEPTTLVCLDKNTGQVLWQADNSMYQTLPPDQVEPMREQLKAVERQTRAKGEIEKKLHKAKRVAKRRPNDAGAQQRAAELQARVDAMNEKLGPVANFTLPRTHGANGHATPTPVSDGEHVWVLFGNGVAACYDLEGNRRWIRLIERPTAGWGQSSSPALADGTLVILINQLHGIDARTGQTKWQVDSKQSWGTPVAITLGGRDLIITPHGQAVDPATGEVLAEGLGKVTYAAPVPHGEVLYFIENRSNAVRLSLDDAGKLSVQNLWDASIPGSRHYASPIIHDGLIYALSREEILTVMNAEDGSTVYERTIDLGGKKPNSVYPSITLAGDNLYLSSESGKTIVLAPGLSYKEVATNKLEGFRASPVFEGNRLYLRGFGKLWCIKQPATVAAD